MRALRAVWRTLTAPPVQERIFLVMYLGAIAGGVWILAEPPRTVEGAWGTIQTIIWGGFLLFGGLVGAATVRTRFQIVERIALTSLSFFMLLYFMFLASQHVLQSGSRSASITALFFGALLVVLRWAEIWRFDYTPPRREER